MMICAGKDGRSSDGTVTIDRHFSPKARHVDALETSMIPVDHSNVLGVASGDSAVTEETKAVKQGGMTERNHLLGNVTVKGNGRVWDRTSWRNESDARRLSLIRYDCDEDVDMILDEGGVIPFFSDWLKSKNSLFAGNTEPSDILLMKRGTEGMAIADTVKPLYRWFIPEEDEEGRYFRYAISPPYPWQKYYRDGLSYKNRPIVWIVDNMFVTITSFFQKGDEMAIHIMDCDNKTNSVDIPVSLDDVKTVYISEDPRSMLKHIRCDEIENMQPVVVYCFTHYKFKSKTKGVRNTHVQGFSVPSVFKSEDYSVLPPMDDFRRTLYWNPDLRIDSTGKAHIEFYNNSTCTGMFVDVEGVNENGQVIGQ